VFVAPTPAPLQQKLQARGSQATSSQNLLTPADAISAQLRVLRDPFGFELLFGSVPANNTGRPAGSESRGASERIRTRDLRFR